MVTERLYRIRCDGCGRVFREVLPLDPFLSGNTEITMDNLKAAKEALKQEIKPCFAADNVDGYPDIHQLFDMARADGWTTPCIGLLHYCPDCSESLPQVREIEQFEVYSVGNVSTDCSSATDPCKAG